jgi:hypothetical protein
MSPEVQRALDKARQETPQQPVEKDEDCVLRIHYKHTLPGHETERTAEVKLSATKMKKVVARLENLFTEL